MNDYRTIKLKLDQVLKPNEALSNAIQGADTRTHYIQREAMFLLKHYFLSNPEQVVDELSVNLCGPYERAT
jgi:hypothetical protein